MIHATLICVYLYTICASRAKPLTDDLLNTVNINNAVSLDTLQKRGNFSDLFPGNGGDVVVSEVGNKMMKVAGDLPSNGTLLIQGESYMELFDPRDIQDPFTVLQKIKGVKKRPVSVSLAVTEPYFLFSTPPSAQLALDKITGNPSMQGMKIGSLNEIFKLRRVKRHHPTVLSSMLTRLQSYALVPIKTQTGATRYLLLKDPKFIVHNKGRPHHTNHPQVDVKLLQQTAGSSAQVPGNKPPTNSSPVREKPGKVSPTKSRSGIALLGRMPPEAGGGRVAPVKDRSGMVQLGRMPPEAGGGGLTAANQASVFQSPTTLTNIKEQSLSGKAKAKSAVNNGATTMIESTTAAIGEATANNNAAVKATSKNNAAMKATSKNDAAVKATSKNDAAVKATYNNDAAVKATSNNDTTLKDKSTATASQGKLQEIVNFENARSDSLAKLNAIIENNAQRTDVVNFAKSMLATMQTLNILVLRNGGKREIASFAQSMLSGMKELDRVFKTGNKEEVAAFAQSLTDQITQFNIEAEAPPPPTQKPEVTTTTAEPTKTTKAPTTVTTEPTAVTEEYDPPTTTEEYEMEELMVTTDFPMGTTVDMAAEQLTGGAWQAPTTKMPPAPGIAGWQGTTTEPALGPLDRINTTDVPEEIEARPDKTPAEKRREFLELNPHLRGKLKRNKNKKRKTTTAAPVITTAPDKTSASKDAAVQSKTSTPASLKKKNKSNSKRNSGVENIILRNKNPKKKGKLKISGSRSTIPAPDPSRYRSPLYRRWNQLLQYHTLRNPWLYLLGYR